MLVLTRRPGEVIHVGDDTILMLLEIRGSSIKVGICKAGTEVTKILKNQEAYHLADEISFINAGTRGKQARLGFNAPREVAIVRGEIMR